MTGTQITKPIPAGPPSGLCSSSSVCSSPVPDHEGVAAQSEDLAAYRTWPIAPPPPDVRLKIKPKQPPKTKPLQESQGLKEKELQSKQHFGSSSHNPVVEMFMKEAPGQAGQVLVFRPCSKRDIIEAIAHVSWTK